MIAHEKTQNLLIGPDLLSFPVNYEFIHELTIDRFLVQTMNTKFDQGKHCVSISAL
jgi:hypothetical protein